MTQMKAWIGCLACYNEGRLTGEWYDAETAGEVTIEQVHRDGGAPLVGLNTPDASRWSPEGEEPAVLVEDHEELWVMDHDGFGGLLKGECSPSEAQRIADLVKDLDDNDRDALVVYLDHKGGDLDERLIEDFRDSYRGRWDDEETYAQDLAEEMEAVPKDHSWPASYIDWERAARDLFMDLWSGDAAGGGIHVFDPH